jgi:FG-GAP-like repeat
VAIVVALAASAMPSAALADGSYDFQSDQAHVVAHAKTTDGKNAYYFVFNFPSAVTAATTSNQARCQISNDPKVVKCFVSATGATGPSLDAMFTLANPMTCSDTIGLESSVDGQTYRPDGTLAFSGNCNPQPQPNPEPGAGPAPQPTPDEQPAGGPVSHPRNPIVVGAGAGGGPHVRLFEPPALSSFFQFDAFAPGFTGGVRVAAGDVNGDGLTDVIVGAGPGGGPNVKVYDGKTGSLLQSFFAFDPSVMGGVFVAAGDVNGDGRADIIVALDSGGGPVVKVFNGADLSVLQVVLRVRLGLHRRRRRWRRAERARLQRQDAREPELVLCLRAELHRWRTRGHG